MISDNTVKDMKELEAVFQLAKAQNEDIAIELTVPTREDTEIIIVKHNNLDYKLDYYKDNYSNNLILNRCSFIRIVAAKTIKFEM